jgi:hypothetical protein
MIGDVEGAVAGEDHPRGAALGIGLKRNDSPGYAREGTAVSDQGAVASVGVEIELRCAAIPSGGSGAVVDQGSVAAIGAENKVRGPTAGLICRAAFVNDSGIAGGSVEVEVGPGRKGIDPRPAFIRYGGVARRRAPVEGGPAAVHERERRTIVNDRGIRGTGRLPEEDLAASDPGEGVEDLAAGARLTGKTYRAHSSALADKILRHAGVVHNPRAADGHGGYRHTDGKRARPGVEDDAVEGGSGLHGDSGGIRKGKGCVVSRPVRDGRWSPVGRGVPVAADWIEVPSRAVGVGEIRGYASN